MNITAPDQNSTRYRDGEIDFHQILRQLWGGRWWIGVCFCAVTLIAVGLAFFMTPVYRASTVLISTGSERNNLSNSLGAAAGSLSALATLAGVGVATNDPATEEALAVLRSRQFAETFITDNQLIPVFFASEWDKTRGRWKVPLDKQPTIDSAFRYFDRNVRFVDQDSKTGLVTLQIDWRDRIAAARWANELVQRLNAEMRQRAISEADASLGYLAKELGKTSVVDTRDAINRLIEAQVNRRMIATVTSEYAFRVVDPAVVVDKNDVLRPRKWFIISLGAISGLLIGVISVLLFKRVA